MYRLVLGRNAELATNELTTACCPLPHAIPSLKQVISASGLLRFGEETGSDGSLRLVLLENEHQIQLDTSILKPHLPIKIQSDDAVPLHILIDPVYKQHAVLLEKELKQAKRVAIHSSRYAETSLTLLANIIPD